MSGTRARHKWAMDFTEPEATVQQAQMPKPPGYSEMHAQDLDETKVATRKVDMLSMKLKVRARGCSRLRCTRAAPALRPHLALPSLTRASPVLCTPCVLRRKRGRSPGRPARTS